MAEAGNQPVAEPEVLFGKHLLLHFGEAAGVGHRGSVAIERAIGCSLGLCRIQYRYGDNFFGQCFPGHGAKAVGGKGAVSVDAVGIIAGNFVVMNKCHIFLLFGFSVLGLCLMSGLYCWLFLSNPKSYDDFLD